MQKNHVSFSKRVFSALALGIIFPISEKLINEVTLAMQQGYNQYAPMIGLAELRNALAKKIKFENGVLFAVPLANGQYGIGLVTQKYKRITIGYFFNIIFQIISTNLNASLNELHRPSNF